MSGRIGDLTTLANVKAWRSPVIATTTDDAQLQREITACSKFILNYFQRSLTAAVYTERRNGNGRNAMRLRNRPIISVTSVTDYVSPIPPVNFTGGTYSGFSFDSNPDPLYNTGMLYLNDYCFSRGQQNITIVYEAGLLIQNEAVTLAGATFPCSSLFELWAAPYSVRYAASGVLLTPVASAPSIGQYVPASAPDGQYTFNAADIGAQLLFHYSYTPRDVEAGVITTIIMEYNRRSRIGEDSKSLAGEVVTYSKRAMADSVIDMLFPYVDVALIEP